LFEKTKPRRKFIRLQGFDYASEGGYFITVVTHRRLPIFGEIINGEMKLSPAGEVAKLEWFRTKSLRDYVDLFEDEFVVMPNHIHGIIWLNGINTVGVERRSTPTTIRANVIPGSIPAIVRAYKSAVTYAIHSSQNTHGLPIWQRNYYEHIIGNEKDYETIAEYIYNNSLNWESDEEFSR
jgi:REP element-mobilizing transposase RayT